MMTPLRTRLAWLFALLCTLAVALTAAVAYQQHAKDQYVTLDRVLLLSANHVAAGVKRTGSSYVLDAERDPLDVILRLYDANGQLVQATPNADGFPKRAALTEQGASALLPDARAWLPAGVTLSVVHAEQARWRRLSMPLRTQAGEQVVIEALTPLKRVDESLWQLARTLALSGALAVLAVALSVWWAAGKALAPIARLTATARGIARSGDLRRRVAVQAGRADELSRLASTFNAMLASLEQASLTQQHFVQDASHELRAPVTVIRGNLELLRRYPDMPAAERAAVLQDAEVETERLARLIHDLLLLARLDAGLPLKRDAVDLSYLVREVTRASLPLARGQDVQLRVADHLEVRGDADRLGQVLRILLDNAFRYTAPGTGVEVRAGACSADQVEVQVRDDGPGVPEADTARLFERFYRVRRHREQDGTGLGLAIARRIVEDHGGRIALQSGEGRGTTVTVTLPAAPRAPARPGVRDGADAPFS